MSTEHLDDVQLARVEALQAAKELLRTSSGGGFVAAKLADAADQALALVELAEYILSGPVEELAEVVPIDEPRDVYGVGDSFARTIEVDGRHLQLVTSIKDPDD